MTRAEFLDSVTSWGDLIDFCYNFDCYVCENVYYEDSYNECIDDELCDLVRHDGWTDIRNYLDSLPTGYDYYLRDDWGEWSGLSEDDVDEYIREALDWADADDIWENEDEEEDDDEDPLDPEEDDTPVEEEDISFGELFSACSSSVQHICLERKTEAERIEAEAEQEFNEFIGGIMSAF